MAGSRTVHVLSAGDEAARGRNFAPFFCRYGLAAIGPAAHGPFTAVPDRYTGHVRRFCELPAGDILALRLGAVVTAVGEIVEAPYQFVPGLGHADGWDLRHVRRIAWRRVEALSLKDHSKSPLATANPETAKALLAAWEQGRPASSGTEYLPDLNGIGDQGVLSNLAAHGAPFDRLDAVAAGLVRARRLAAWQQANGASVDEVRALLVIPFLESLGWSPFGIRLDWRRRRRGKTDGQALELALLDRPDRTGSAPRMALVVSRPGGSLGKMVRHAEKAVGGASGARLLAATDGRMWQVRIRREQHWEPWATLDLVWPTARFHFDPDAADIPGATEAIEALSPWAVLPPRVQKEAAPELPPEVVAHLAAQEGGEAPEGRKRKRRRRRRKSGQGTNAPQAAPSEGDSNANDAAPAAEQSVPADAPATAEQAAPAPSAPVAAPAPAPDAPAEQAPVPKAEAPAPAEKAAEKPVEKPAPAAAAAPTPDAE